jgi:hypothetical protein
MKLSIKYLLGIFINDGCIEIIPWHYFGKWRALIFCWPPAFAFISYKLTFTWNVDGKYKFSIWWSKR